MKSSNSTSTSRKAQKREKPNNAYNTNSDSNDSASSPPPKHHRFESIPHLLINKYYHNDYRLLGKLSTLTTVYEHSAKMAHKNLMKKLATFIVDTLTIHCNDVIQSSLFLEVSQNMGRTLNAFVIILDTPDELLRLSVSVEPSATPLWYYMFHLYPTKLTTFRVRKNEKKAALGKDEEPSIVLKIKNNNEASVLGLKKFVEKYLERSKTHKISIQCVMEFVTRESDCLMNYKEDDQAVPIYLNGLDLFNHTNDWQENIMETQAGILEQFNAFEPVKFINMTKLEEALQKIFEGSHDNDRTTFAILEKYGLTVAQNSLLKHRYEYLTSGKYYQNIAPFIKGHRNSNTLSTNSMNVFNFKNNVQEYNDTNVSNRFAQTANFIVYALTKYVNDVVQSSMFLNVSQNNRRFLSSIRLDIEAVGRGTLSLDFLINPQVNALWSFMFPVYTEVMVHGDAEMESMGRKENRHYAIKRFVKKINDFLKQHFRQQMNFEATFLLDEGRQPDIEYTEDEDGNPINISGMERYSEKFWGLPKKTYLHGGGQRIVLKEFNRAMSDIYNERHSSEKGVLDILDEYGLVVGKNSLIKYKIDKYSTEDYTRGYFRVAGQNANGNANSNGNSNENSNGNSVGGGRRMVGKML